MFKRLLGIETEYGYIAVLEFGENVVGDRMTNVQEHVLLSKNITGRLRKK